MQAHEIFLLVWAALVAVGLVCWALLRYYEATGGERRLFKALSRDIDGPHAALRARGWGTESGERQ